jgi:hypothetical protein
MNALERFEAWCSNLVESTFARAFPSALQPAQVARKLVATIERSPPPKNGARASRYTIRLSAADAARLDAERELLERQWSRMTGALCARAGIATPAAPEVVLQADPGLSNGSIAIDVDHPAADEPTALSFRVERGMPLAKSRSFPAWPLTPLAAVIGRDAACDIVVRDPRASRRHVRLNVHQGRIDFEDLGSSNGTLCNGDLLVRGALRVGDRLQVGDTTLVVDAEAVPA